MAKVIYYPSAKQNWTPAAYPDSMWMDAVDSSALTLSGSGAVQWNDRNVSGRYFTQATSTAQPQYQATGLNGKGVLIWDGNDLMVGVNTDFYASDWCAVAVSRHTNTATNGTFWAKWNSGANQREHTFRIASGSGLATAISTNGTTSSLINYPTSVGTSYGIFATYKNGATALNSFNGLQQSPVTTSSAVFNGTAQYQLGALGGSEFLNGGMQKVVFIPGAYSLSVLQQLEGWAAWDSGLQTSLAAGHPYKNAPPYL